MNDNDIRRTIADSSFFAGLNDKAIDFLAAHARRRELGRGKVLFHPGDAAESFVLILKGHLSLVIPALEGPELELQDIGPDQVVGWSWLIPPHRWTMLSRARSDIECLEFDGKSILTECEADPKFGLDFCRRFSSLMSERLQFAGRRMMQEWRPPGFA